MTNLPDTWKWSTLGEQCDLYQPKTISREKMITDGLYEVYGANGVIGMYNEYNHEDSEVLLSCRGNCGTVNVSKPKSWINGNAMVCRPKTPALLKNYLRYYLESVNFAKVITGTAQQQITREPLSKVEIAIPSIEVQHKIVELLEDHLSRLDAALADVKSAQSKSSQLKFAILRKVFSGEFFEFDIPLLPLEELAKVMNGDRGKNYPNKSARVISGIPFINAGHLDNDLLNVEDMDFISDERYKLLAAGKVELNDLLFCLRGSLGKVAINDKFIEGAIASSLAILRVNSKVLPKYLYYYFLSPFAAIEIKKYDNGTAQPNLSAANLKQFEVPTPTLEQQKVVIDFLESELSRTIQASQTFDSLFSMASAVRRSLLQAAFTGQLTKEVVSV
jgi:type I restriction enzyme S subunit